MYNVYLTFVIDQNEENLNNTVRTDAMIIKNKDC